MAEDAQRASWPARNVAIAKGGRLVDWIIIPPRRPTVAHIQRLTAAHFGSPVQAMTGAGKHRDVSRPRQVAMYLARQRTKRSLPDIGRRFGGRDHTTVLHAIRTVERLRESDPEFDGQVSALEAML